MGIFGGRVADADDLPSLPAELAIDAFVPGYVVLALN